MEELDRQIVQLLVADGRMSYTDLGKATGLSTSAVHQRVRRLEQRGVIRGYAAVVDPEAVGLPMTAFISVKPFDPSAPDDIAERLAGVPEIEACHSVMRRRELHPQGPCGDPARVGGTAREAAVPGGGVDADDGGAVHAVRGEAAEDLTVGRRSPLRAGVPPGEGALKACPGAARRSAHAKLSP